MGKKEIFYAQLVDMSSPSAVFAEVCHLAGIMAGEIDINRLEIVFSKTCDLYRGRYRGYRACNTLYHDLRHTTDVFLSLARLLHGAFAAGVSFSPTEATMALISTLLHDTGYIQKSSDRTGTGGKYTLTHVTRSVTFLQTFLPSHGFTSEETDLCEAFVLGTCIRTELCKQRLPTESALLLGKMIGTADLLGQLADRIYLEKLLFLYREFREANIVGYSSELELLNNTIGFYTQMEIRMVNDLSNVKTYMQTHFKQRWGVDRDLYQESIARNLDFLKKLLKQHRKDYRNELKREGLVQKLVALEAAEGVQQGTERDGP
jgi:hypothetical protein